MNKIIATNLRPKLILIGGGPTSLSMAYHLVKSESGILPSDIKIVERDVTYSANSAVLSAGGIRTQFR